VIDEAKSKAKGVKNMVAKVKPRKKSSRKTAWDKLSKKEQKRLLDDYEGRVYTGMPSKRIAEKIAKLKGIPYKKSAGRKTVKFT
jgi:hypothetical protein